MSTSTTITTDRTTWPARDLVTTAIPVIAVACFSVHVALLLATGTSMLTMSVAMLLLSGLCVACTWRSGGAHDRRDQSVVAAVALTMILVHLLLMPSGAEGGHGLDHAAMGHAGTHMSSSSSGLMSSGAVYALMHAGVALAAVQLVLAVGAALRPRQRSTA